MKKTRKIKTRDLIRFGEGEVTRSRAQEIENWLEENPTDAKRFSRMKRMMQQLKEVDSDLEHTDLVPAVRDAVSKIPSTTRESTQPFSRPMSIALASLIAAACVVVAIGIVYSQHLNQAPSKVVATNDTEFRAKSSGRQAPERERWCGITPYRLSNSRDPNPIPLGKQILKKDFLGFSYTNLSEHPFKYLMIFAVDAFGKVFWYYPAYLDEKADPESIEISGGKRIKNMSLHTVINHELVPGPLNIYALFSDQPLKVSEIEGIVSRQIKLDSTYFKQPQRLPMLNVENFSQHVVQTMVAQ